MIITRYGLLEIFKLWEIYIIHRGRLGYAKKVFVEEE